MVPDMESKFKINEALNWYDEDDLIYRINEYDEYAVEEAIRLKESKKDSFVTVLSVGNRLAEDSIRKVLSMGADKGVHIVSETQEDSYQAASLVYTYAKDKNFDIVFTGMQSLDSLQMLFPPYLSGLLKYNFVTGIVDFKLENNRIIVKKELENGLKVRLKLNLPAVVGCQLGLNTVRYPTLPNIMRAKKKELISIDAKSLGDFENMAETKKVYYPAKNLNTIYLEGNTEETASSLIKILKEKGLI